MLRLNCICLECSRHYNTALAKPQCDCNNPNIGIRLCDGCAQSNREGKIPTCIDFIPACRHKKDTDCIHPKWGSCRGCEVFEDED